MIYQIKIEHSLIGKNMYDYSEDLNYCDYPLYFKSSSLSNNLFCVIHGTSDGLINNCGSILTLTEFYHQNVFLLKRMKDIKRLIVISCCGGNNSEEKWIKFPKDNFEVIKLITSKNDIETRIVKRLGSYFLEIKTDSELFLLDSYLKEIKLLS